MQGRPRDLKASLIIVHDDHVVNESIESDLGKNKNQSSINAIESFLF